MSTNLIYHYTTATGLNGILSSGSIYATDAEFLNDTQELRYGRRELCEALDVEVLSSPGTVLGPLDGNAARIGRMAAAMTYLTDDSVRASAALAAVFITCFCDDGDLLSQWRGYASPGGYAIGFDTAVLTALVEADPDHLELHQVAYGPDAIETMVEHVIASYRPEPPISPGGSTVKTEGWRDTNSVLRQLAMIKHPAFKAEAEWRIIARSDPAHAVSFREGALGLTPYRSIKVSDAIREIVVGPGPHQRTRELAVRRLANAHGISDTIHVRTSSASYRG